MGGEISPVSSSGPPDRHRNRIAALVQAFLAARRRTTLAAYRRDLLAFADFLGVGEVEEAAWRLLSLPQGEANALVLRFRQSMQEGGASAATVNRRLAALRSLSRLARLVGLVPWTIEVQDLPSERYRDTRGPGSEGFRKMLAVLAGRDNARVRRDRAILRMLYDLGLRRSELTGLLIGHLDFVGRRVWVLGKGRSAREALTLPEVTYEAIRDWLRVHPGLLSVVPGQDVSQVPLFVSLDNAFRGHRLSGRGVDLIVSRIGKAAGLRVWPHALRHAAITEALDATGGDVRGVQRFARHRNPATTMLYDDNRTDLAGKVSRIVAERSK